MDKIQRTTRHGFVQRSIELRETSGTRVTTPSATVFQHGLEKNSSDFFASGTGSLVAVNFPIAGAGNLMKMVTMADKLNEAAKLW
jgi:hypothetical protein